MRSPTLTELPPPPPGKAGWPWTAESPQLPDPMPDGRPWPRVSIVTPSYNQAQFIEETIRSVLLQGYPDLEYMIIDGGSTDGSVEIIRKYEPWLAYWVSEKDRGQADAINKGWSRATGRVIAWLNSDDYYLSGALAEAMSLWQQFPEASILYGDVVRVDYASREIDRPRRGPFSRDDTLHFWRYRNVQQPAAFFDAGLLGEVGYLDTTLHMIMDYDFVLRTSNRGKQIVHVDRWFTCFRLHDSSKTMSANYRFAREFVRLARRYEPLIRSEVGPGYIAKARRHYSDALVDTVLRGRPADGRSGLHVMAVALYHDPSKLRVSWILRLLVKTFLGPKWTERVRPLYARFFSEQRRSCGGKQ